MSDEHLANPLNNSSGELDGHMIFCPACKCCHHFDKKRWKFNGDLDKPTFTPSMLVHEGRNHPLCHSFVTDGKIKFLGDCTHDMKNQTVDLKPF